MATSLFNAGSASFGGEFLAPHRGYYQIVFRSLGSGHDNAMEVQRGGPGGLTTWVPCYGRIFGGYCIPDTAGANTEDGIVADDGTGHAALVVAPDTRRLLHRVVIHLEQGDRVRTEGTIDSAAYVGEYPFQHEVVAHT